jgi:GT2 family glycosyltransferase
MRVSLIICTYNRPTYLRETVTHAMAQDYDDLEIIVVDQTPRNPPEVEAYLAPLSPPRFIYKHLESPSLPVARNQGLALASGEVVIFIDDDVEIQPDFVAKHVEAHRKWERISLTTHSKLPVGGISGADLSPVTPTWAVVWARQMAHYGDIVLEWHDAWQVPWLTGCNMSFRREILLEVGGFDERLTGGAWGEDVDISLSLRALGYRLVMERELGLWHHQAQEGGGDHRTKDTERQQRERMTAWLYLIRKHWRTFGVREALWRWWRQYRMYAGSLALWRQGGMRLVVRRHAEFFRAWRQL